MSQVLTERKDHRVNGTETTRALFESFDRHGVGYCHWKSNHHLEAGLRGETDLDVLVDRADAETVQTLLLQSGFKRFANVVGMGYPAIEDYLALDVEAGRLAHCHLHYRLIIGEHRLKGITLPWEKRFLDTRVWDSEAGLYVADPHLELVTFVTRAALKMHWREKLRDLSRDSTSQRSFRAELEWLLSRADRSRVPPLCTLLLGEAAGDALTDVLAGAPGTRALRRFRKAAWPRIARFRAYGPLESRARQTARQFVWLTAGVSRRYLRVARPLRRTLPTGGLLVAVLGPDGSGKSTITKHITSLMSPKCDVLYTYFGSGDGPSSALRWPLKLLHSIAPGRRRRTSVRHQGVPGPRRRSALRSAAVGVWGIVLAREKRRKLMTAWRARNRGMLVLSDRFPQTQIVGYNDGPLLNDWADHRWGVLRRIARWELETYRLSEVYAPDLVIKLDVDVDTALGRKPETGAFGVERRIKAIAQLQFPERTSVVHVDASRDLPTVLRDVTQILWRHI